MSSITNTYFDHLPIELIVTCIPNRDDSNFLSLFKNPKQLFKIWFNLNYPEYFTILELDSCQKVTFRKGIFSHLFTYFKQNFKREIYIEGYDDFKEHTYKLMYPIILLRDYPELYNLILKNIDK